MTALHPFYVVGAWIGTVVVLAIAVGLARRYAARCARACVDRARRARATLGAAERLDETTLAHGRVVTFEGTLHGKSVRVGEGLEIALVGPRDVLVGTEESRSGAIKRLREGATVRVRGELERAAAGGYRDTETHWSVAPRVGARGVSIASIAEPRLLHRPAIAAIGFVRGAFVAAAGLTAIGALCEWRASHASVGSDDGLRLSCAAIAAATPMRARALRAEAAVLSGPQAGADELARALRLCELAGDDADAANLRERVCIARANLDAPPEEAAGRYAACGVHDLPTDVYFAMGRFVEASDASRLEDERTSQDRDHLLRMAEAHLAAHHYERSAIAIGRYRVISPGEPADRLEVLDCLRDAVRARGTGMVDDPHSARAACTVLFADLLPRGTRAGRLGDGSFVWGDAQGMEFAKLLVNRIVQALLVEDGATGSYSPGVFKYSLYPDAYLAATRPATEAWEMQRFDLGNDVAHMEWYERTHLEEHAYAIWGGVAGAREHDEDPDEVRMHASAHVALLLAALGDAEGARRHVDRVREVPGGVTLGYWTRPTPDAVSSVVDRLLRGERPYRFRGVFFGALTGTLDRAVASTPTARVARAEIHAFELALLDREICVPLLLVEAFARRGWLTRE